MLKIEFQNISKQFGEIKANDDISFTIDSGTIHAIIGENGAGKSTLIKILSGQLTPDNGTISKPLIIPAANLLRYGFHSLNSF